MTSLRLMSSDKKVFSIDSKAAKCSTFIGAMIDHSGVDYDEPPVPLEVTGDILEKVIEWCEYHKDDYPTTEAEDKERRYEDVLPWDQDFFNVDHTTLFHLIRAANYLGIRRMMYTGCKIVAKMMHGKTAKEIREIFGIKCDFSPEELERIRLENQWIYETSS